MISNWPVWAVIIVDGGPILLAMIAIAYSLYLGRHLDAMMEALKNSRYICIWGPALRNQGWFGCIALVSKIAGMVVWSTAYIRIGDVDPVDIKNFPPHLRWMLTINLLLIFVSLIWMAIDVALMRI
ncbi:hypothetical protein [Pseudomonas sp. GV085]|uniref:hypothetical protein n=1 Tax=Pseudomonas sp. GV085 TaxID=2135756 RepID=UPI000D39BCA6|nr:hypothetical protein [Pseudomonas sp. GV085]